VKSFRSMICGVSLFGAVGRAKYRWLVANQPLLLIREPDNPVDENAVMIADVLGNVFGYVARIDAAKIAPSMDKGEIWMCKVLAKPFILIWRDETGLQERTEKWLKRKRVDYLREVE
jgi:hypothetical protein